MKKLKIMTVVGTRPEIIRLSCVIKELDNSPAVEHVLVHTGQNYDYELNEIFFSDLGLRKPDYFLDAAGSSATETIGKIIIAIDPILEEESPDSFLVLGDTNSCLCAIPAKKRKIPIFHMEAGNRCFDMRVPEETNRRIVDHISDINLPYSSIAREYLLREGLSPDRVIKTGSPMKEVLNSVMNKINKEAVLKKHNLNEGCFFLVSCHREENVNSDNFYYFIDLLNTLAEIYSMPIIVSTHPRTRKKIESENISFSNLIKLSKPLGYCDYLGLQVSANIVLSDSGTISEESSILGFKAINIRDTHERPEAMEEGSVMMTGMKKDRVLQAVAVLNNKLDERMRTVYDYGIDNVSKKVLRIMISYTDYINNVVWRKK